MEADCAGCRFEKTAMGASVGSACWLEGGGRDVTSFHISARVARAPNEVQEEEL